MLIERTERKKRFFSMIRRAGVPEMRMIIVICNTVGRLKSSCNPFCIHFYGYYLLYKKKEEVQVVVCI